MKELEYKITKETGKLLTDIRKKAHLTQEEMGERLGFSGKSGRVYVSRLERGRIENPSLWLILKYLSICEKPWASFFEQLSGIYFNKEHEKVMSQIPTSTEFRKVDRDVAKYTHSIETKFSRKQDIKPIEQKQKEKMSAEFGKYRAVIEDIEREVTLLLGESAEPYLLNQFYKAFARECYSILKKNNMPQTRPAPFDKMTSDKQIIQNLNNTYLDKRYGVNTDEKKTISTDINDKLNLLVEKWVKKGLKREILEKIKEIPMKYFKPQVNTDEH
jgi:transcriptional regulator with XRE-family HTH domain